MHIEGDGTCLSAYVSHLCADNGCLDFAVPLGICDEGIWVVRHIHPQKCRFFRNRIPWHGRQLRTRWAGNGCATTAKFTRVLSRSGLWQGYRFIQNWPSGPAVPAYAGLIMLAQRSRLDDPINQNLGNSKTRTCTPERYSPVI